MNNSRSATGQNAAVISYKDSSPGGARCARGSNLAMHRTSSDRRSRQHRRRHSASDTADRNLSEMSAYRNGLRQLLTYNKSVMNGGRYIALWYCSFVYWSGSANCCHRSQTWFGNMQTANDTTKAINSRMTFRRLRSGLCCLNTAIVVAPSVSRFFGNLGEFWRTTPSWGSAR